MNRYALYALKSDGNDYARTDAIENCSFNGGTNFTFGMDIYCTMQNGLVFSQNNSISCLLQSGSIVWKGIGWELIADKNYSAVMMDEWNHIDVVYDTSKVSLYLNGVLASETETVGEPIYSTDEYRYLGGYCGYIKNVRIVDHAMTEKEMRENLIITAIPEENLWLYIPFDSTKPEDKGIYKKQVQCKGFCYCKDFVKALYFTGKGYALMDGVSDNPGSDQCPVFTIVMRIFPDGYTSDTAVLFENSGSNDLLQICLLKESKLQINIGTNQIVTDEIQAIKDCLWTDIAVSVNGTELKVYAAGVLVKATTIEKYVRTSYPHMVLGNNFIGAIDYFAIYGEPLTDSYVAEIHNIEPYIFDSGISTLFLFHGEKETNMLGSGSVLLHDEAAFSMLEGTLYGAAPEKFDYRVDEEYVGTDLEEWAIALLGGLGFVFVAVAVGIVMKESTLDGGLKKIIAEQVLSSNEAQSILGNYANITEKELESLISTTTVGPEMISACTTAAAKATIPGAAAVAAAKASTYPIFLATSVGALAVGSIITAALVSATKPSDPPEEEEEEKKPEKGYNLYLESIQFCNGSEGSIPLRTDFDTPQTLPEWERSESQGIVAAYAAKQQTPKITIRFKYMPAKDQKPVKVKFYFGNFNLLGAGESEEIECSVAETVYEANIICNNNKLHEAGMGKQHGKASFRFEPVGGDKDAPTNIRIKYVDMDIHTLCKDPIEPWSITDKAKAPLVPVLDMAAEISKLFGNKLTVEEDFLSAIAKWLQQQSNFKLKNESIYSVENCNRVKFYFKGFWDTLQSSSIEAGILDWYMFAMEIASIEGFSLNLYQIFSEEDYKIDIEGNYYIETQGIALEKCNAFQKEADVIFNRTYIFGNDVNNPTEFWDILFTSSKTGESQLNVSWENYQNTFISNWCYIEKIFVVSNWEEITTPILQTAFDKRKGMFISSKRQNFKSYIKREFYYPENEACCHRISYHVIEEMLNAIFNFYTQGKLVEADIDYFLSMIKNTFYSILPAINTPEYDNYGIMEASINELLRLNHTEFIETLKDDKGRICIVAYINNLLGSLNNCMNNLRTGFSNWNSSIGQRYDPVSWMTIFPLCNNIYKYDNNDRLVPYTEGKLGFGYYIGDGWNEIDGRFINLLKELSSISEITFFDFCIGTYLKQVENGYVRIPIVYSSNNHFNFQDSNNTVTLFAPTYIYMDGGYVPI